MGRKQNELGRQKYFANRGVERNKKPLPNIIYRVEIVQLREDLSYEKLQEMERYKFKDLGYISLYQDFQTGNNKGYNGWIGFVTPDNLKERIGVKQWAKFCGEGKREFIIQRRIDGNNVKLDRSTNGN